MPTNFCPSNLSHFSLAKICDSCSSCDLSYDEEGNGLETKRILILAANPQNTSRLRLDEEVREIEEGLRRSQYRDTFELQARWATRPQDIRRAMLDFHPNIVHFCGHGEGETGIIFEDSAGEAKFRLRRGPDQCDPMGHDKRR
jgi:hypothetical protein